MSVIIEARDIGRRQHCPRCGEGMIMCGGGVNPQGYGYNTSCDRVVCPGRCHPSFGNGHHDYYCSLHYDAQVAANEKYRAKYR